VCKYGLLYLVASAIVVLRVQLRFVDCINKRKKKKKKYNIIINYVATLSVNKDD